MNPYIEELVNDLVHKTKININEAEAIVRYVIGCV